MIKLVLADARRWAPEFTFPRFLYTLFLQPGFQLALMLRIQHELAKLPLVGKLMRRIVYYLTTIYFGSDICPGVQIGAGIYFPHPQGVVIGGTTVLGRNVTVLQGVTLGNSGPRDARCPTLHDNVAVNAGAKVLGGITLGEGSVVGANAVVLKDVPANHLAVGVPARVLPLGTENSASKGS